VSEPSLYRWPAAAKFGRVVPKSKFYERGAVTAAVREKFVSEVKRITWAYKLADETLHLRGNAEVPEIQVFAIDAKDAEVSDGVLAAIDRAVKFPIIFEIKRTANCGAEIRMAACHKQLGTSTPKLSAYFGTGWTVAETERAAMPISVDLPALYAALISPILPIPVLPGERPHQTAERLAQTAKLEREISVIERRLRTEPQFNRKVELRRELQAATEVLTKITNPAIANDTSNSEKVDQWTS